MIEKKENNFGDFSNLDFDFIESIYSSFNYLIWEKNRFTSIVMIIFSIIVTIIIFFIGLYDLWPLGVFILILYFGYFYIKAKNHFFENFAEKNNLKYQSSISLKEVKGSLFKVDDFKKISNAITGNFKNKKARFFHYEYKDYKLTVFEIFFKKTNFPYILLQSKRMIKFGDYDYRKKTKKEIEINLENEFKRNYSLFGREGYAIEVMQIFTTDFLRFLKEENSNFSIELKEDRMYIYDDIVVKNKRQFQELCEVTEEIINKIAPLLKRLKNDFEALHPYFNKEKSY